MNRLIMLFTVAVILVTIATGCSGSNTDPVSPAPDDDFHTELAPDRYQTGGNSGTQLWGYYDVILDPDSGSMEIVPNRSGMFALNVVKFLNNDPAGISLSFNGTSLGPDYVDVDVDITLTHPIDNEKFDGYDVRGVFIGNGSGVMDYNSCCIYPAAGTDQMLLNADGYTRWFNPSEFGVEGFFGYVRGNCAPAGYMPTATLNGYKLFGDALESDRDMWEYITSRYAWIGYFFHGTSNTRNYQIRFPLPLPGIKYGYAVVATWECGQPQCHPAHCREAIGLSVVDDSTLWYVDETTNGGDINLDLSVFDWHAPVSSVMMEDYTIYLESTVMSGTYQLDASEMTPTHIGNHWHTFHVEVPADNVPGINGNEVWVIVEEADEDYTNPLGIPNNADDDPLAAYFRVPLSVLNEEPAWIEITSPNGGEIWTTSSDHEITWDSGGITSSIDICYSTDDFVSEILPIASGEVNDGTYLWEDIPSVESDTVKVRVSTDIGPSVQDESDDYFSIWTPEITLTRPNGGEEFIVGLDEDITWTSQGVPGTVFIEYSKDGFVSNINPIAADAENTGSFIWEGIPDDESETVRVRVSSTDEPSVTDTSDEDFTIVKRWIEVTVPNGGEEWYPNTDEEITWTSFNAPGTIFLEYSKDSFVSDFHTIATDEPNDGSMWWDPIPLDPSRTVRVRVSATNWPRVNDMSDADFSIMRPSITLTSPNGGEVWPAGGRDREITWTSENLATDTFIDIEYSTDGFVSDVNPVAEDTMNDGSFMWEYLPCVYSDSVTVRVSWAWEPTVFDVSDAEFSLVEAGRASTWGTTLLDEGLAVVSGSDGTIYVGWDIEDAGGDRMGLVTFDRCGRSTISRAWSVTGVQSIELFDMAIDGSGNLYLVGSFDGTDVDFDPHWPDEDLHSCSDWFEACFLTSLTAEGGYRYTRVWEAPGSVQCEAVSTDALGNIYATGNFDSPVDFDPGPGVDEKIANNRDCYVVKFDTAGNYIWTVHWGGVGDDDMVVNCEVSADRLGNVFVAGDFEGVDTDFDPGTDPGEVDLHSSAGMLDAFLSIFDSNGDFQWAGTWGSTDNDQAFGVATDGNGSAYVVGKYTHTVDLDPGDEPGEEDLHVSADSGHVYLSRFNSLGDYFWGVSTGKGGGLEPTAISAHQNGTVLVTGCFWDSPDFCPGTGTDIHSSNGPLNDAYVSCFDSTSAYQWTRTIGGIDDDLSWDVAFGEGAVGLITGYFQGSDVEFAETGAPCFDISDLRTSNGMTDAFLVKYLPDGCW